MGTVAFYNSLLTSGVCGKRFFCIGQAMNIDERMQDIGSRLNYERKQLILLFEPIDQVRVEIVENAHRNRLVRFDNEWFEVLGKRHGTESIVMNNEKLLLAR